MSDNNFQCAEQMAADLIKQEIAMLHNVVNDYKKENNLLTEQVLERDTHIDILDEKIKNQDEEIEKLELFHEWNKSSTLKWNEEVEVNRRLKEEIKKMKLRIEFLEEETPLDTLSSDSEDDDDEIDRNWKCKTCFQAFHATEVEYRCSEGECYNCQRYA